MAHRGEYTNGSHYSDRQNESLAVLMGLQQQDPLLSVPRRPLDYNRNPARVASLRRFLGIPGEDVGDISQQDYEEAAADVERRQREEAETKALAGVLPEVVRGQYGVQAAGVRAQAGAVERRELQKERQAFQAEQAAMNRAAAAERQQAALGAPVVPTLDSRTGLATWTPRAQAAGLRTGGSATEREAITSGWNTLDDVQSVIDMGDKLQWKGVGPTGGIKNTLYKFLGLGSQDEDDFRVLLQKVRADIMFGSGGKQLTTSEQRVAAGYLADIYTHPEAAESRMREVLKILQRHHARRTGISIQSNESDWEDVR